MFRRLIPDPFLLWLMGTLALALLLPARGPFVPVVDRLATTAIVLLFFFHGAKLSRRAVLDGIAHWRLHLMVLSTTFAIFPLLGLGFSAALSAVLIGPLLLGILFLSVLPSTVQSSIAFTAMARGNVAAAIASASASQLAGVFLAPLLMALLAGRFGGGFSFASIGQVLLIVLLPFVAGHLLRPLIGAWVDANKPLIGLSDRSAILLAVFSAFSEATVSGIWSRLPPVDLVILTLVLAGLLAIVLGFTWWLGRRAGLATEDRIVLLFCGSKKSLVQGIPMARVLFAGPELGLILLPVMIYHQIQLMACAVIAQRFAARPPEGSEADHRP